MKTDKGCKDNNNVDIPPNWNDICIADMNMLGDTWIANVRKTDKFYNACEHILMSEDTHYG